MTVFTIPRWNDFLRAGSGAPRLPLRMAALARGLGIDYLDLLAGTRREDPHGYFISCDGHWNAHGHEVAARILLDRAPARAAGNS